MLPGHSQIVLLLEQSGRPFGNVVAQAAAEHLDLRSRPARQSRQGTGPALYKEWKLTGEVTAFGAFSGTNGAKQVLTLILQGRGNSCTSAEDFTHWTLVTEGPKGTYSLFGDLVR